jgi:hypothetical protein
MKRIALITLLVLPLLHAQDAAPIDLEARRQSVVDLKAHIAAREERLKEIAADIRSLDDRNEKRIDSIVNSLKNLKDSESSKTRINALKGEVIAGLRKSITVYQGKRREIFERLRGDKSAAVQALTGDLEKFDARTQKRVEQILELAKSMPARADVDKYESAGIEYRNGWYAETTRISDEWRQNRRQGVATEKSLREIREALEKAIVTLEARKATATEQINDRNFTAAEHAIQEQELGRIDAMLDARRQELVSLALPTGTGTTTDTSASQTTSSTSNPAAKDNADEMKDLLDDARKDIAADFWSILRQYSQAAAERDKIIALKANLEAREKWLTEHAGGEKKAK